MYKIKCYLRCLYPLLFFLPLLTASHFIFGAFYPVYNVLMYFLIISSAHNLFNKRIMFQNMVVVDIAAGITAVIIVFLLTHFQIFLYSRDLFRGVLILVGLNQLYMHSKNNYKERVAVRKEFY